MKHLLIMFTLPNLHPAKSFIFSDLDSVSICKKKLTLNQVDTESISEKRLGRGRGGGGKIHGELGGA